MAKLAGVLLLGMVLFYGEPNLVDMTKRYVQLRLDLYDMKAAICPDQ